MEIKSLNLKHKVLVFRRTKKSENCVGVQGELPSGINIENCFTKGMWVITDFNPIGYSYKTLEDMH